MTIMEAEKFYKQDQEQYIIKKNHNLLTWLKGNVKNGYSPLISEKELQETIDTISNWYEFKYPNRAFDHYERIISYRGSDFKSMESISESMNFQQLMYRLPYNSLELIKVGYRANSWLPKYIENEQDKTTDVMLEIGMTIKLKNTNVDRYPNSFPIFARHKDGVVTDFGDLECDLKKDITLDELILILEKTNQNKLDYSEIQTTVSNHQVDLELRSNILQLVALKLLYSKTTVPERGYERAKRFISEFNKSIPDLNLTTLQIDEIMKRDHSDHEILDDEIIMKKIAKKR